MAKLQIYIVNICTMCYTLMGYMKDYSKKALFLNKFNNIIWPAIQNFAYLFQSKQGDIVIFLEGVQSPVVYSRLQ